MLTVNVYRPVLDSRGEPTYDYDGYPIQTPSEQPARYVGVYEVTRHYGGPEEGGWWYNHSRHILSIPLTEPGSEEDAERVEEFLRERFVGEGDIYSVRGGEEYAFHVEAVEGQYETRHVPYYC